MTKYSRIVFSALGILIILSCATQSGPISTDCTPCSQEILDFSWRNRTALNERDIYNYFCIQSDACKNGAEFIEVNNELLFAVLLEYPQLSLKVLNENSDNKKNFVYAQLENPINDGINLPKTIAAIQAVPGFDTTKQKVLKALTTATSKSKP